ncbi:MAG: hypothetical protein A2021_05560 [Elusimicrobia bacterium GWF2_52_66]|nr:MAG: hypothetical protein A2X33_04695 [Elusimicrobia bacterium GWA2_51_34]OGR87423.1 MAG: hypothetical protein A2021_05560 [Elusimicrobia bacterium GWF2_52_66]HAF96101.1 bifunctional oligoribonuclease/PAP phosphatase NrnA [Elusimicrobiota bacterium]HCE97472.1 bifunctional oligoribonuclease/PAP phosphatase NrnA [Elusimicrobiota bacterium]
MKTPDLEKQLKAFEAVIERSESFFLAGHLNPDGDTLGSMLAIASVLKRLGKKVFLFSQDPAPENLAFLPHLKSVKIARIPKTKFDAAILLECSSPERAGDIGALLKRCVSVVNIDHHRTSQFYGDVNIVEPTASSTAEIVYRLFYNMGVNITKREAICLYTGIVTDTGRFHFPATSPRTLEIASRLLEIGFNFSKINDLLYATRSCLSLKILGRALESLEITGAGKLAVMALRNSDFKDFGASPQHAESVINHGMMVPGVKAAVLLREGTDKVNVTFRSRGNLDVSAVAKALGGGGHMHAAGCRLPEPFEAARVKVLDLLAKMLGKQKKM